MVNSDALIIKIIGGILTGILTFTGYGIINNEIRNIESHKEMTSDYIQRDEKVLNVVTDIRIEQRSLIDAVKRIEKKL